jgi:hypothetical protein
MRTVFHLHVQRCLCPSVRVCVFVRSILLRWRLWFCESLTFHLPLRSLFSSCFGAAVMNEFAHGGEGFF